MTVGQKTKKKMTLGEFLKGTALAGASLAAIYAGTAVSLVYWPDKPFVGAPVVTAEMQAMGEKMSGVVRKQIYDFAPRTFSVRDGTEIFARDFSPEEQAKTTIVLMHGVAGDSAPMNSFAGKMLETSGVRVIAIDHRGHGQSGGKPWAVDHAGQYEEDAADVIAQVRKETPETRIILAGHSMGGGIALRYALNDKLPDVDGYLLMAPLMGGDSPTMQKAAASPEEVKLGEMFVKFRTLRLIGALMLDSVGISAFNNEPILYFNRPSLNGSGMPGYGYSALQSMQPNAPQDYRAALAAIDKPLLLVAGSKDEAFNGPAFEGVIKQYSKGEALIVAGAMHNGVTHDPRAIERVSQWLDAMDSARLAQNTSPASPETGR
jgi:alpha-beta hydrolase superfamily lysophospholipase